MMAAITDAVRKAQSRRKEYGPKFRNQLEKHREFKEKMRAAGYEYGDSYAIPLMARLGHVAKPK
jgi:hypothetical protein